MTNEELFNQNINLAYKLTQKYRNCGIEYEDLKQMCLLGLWKATITFKSNKGYSFSTYSYKVIQNELNYYLRCNRKYFNNKYFSEEVNDGITIEDTIADNHDLINELENEIDIKNLLTKIRNSPLKENERLSFELYIKGYKQKDIAKILGCTQAQVSRYLKCIKDKIGGKK